VYRQLSQGGVSAGYGMEIASVRSSPPRDIRIAFVEPGSPASAARLQRGAKMVKVDGVDVVNSTGTADVNAINRAISPQALGESHTFVLR
jgi:carboxyl-terminal processing protease